MTEAENLLILSIRLAKIKIWIDKRYEENFNFDQEHWENGNFDDSYQYGFDSGEQSTLGAIKNILEDTP